MVFSYRKGLSEEWYSQKLLWVSTFLIYFALFILNYREYSMTVRVDCLLVIVTDFWLIVLMTKTRTRTIQKPRWQRQFLLDNLSDVETGFEEQSVQRWSFHRKGTVKSSKTFVIIQNYFYKSEHSSLKTDSDLS